MRRTAPIITVGLLVLSACGSGSSGDAVGDTLPEPITSEILTSEETDVSDEPVPEPALAEKPTVEIPAEAPTELVRTVLAEGAGEPAVSGDTLIVDYVGVRSSDGVEFDNSYDREPFPITLGSGSVIQGWEEGLLGAKQGVRVQLDIPSELAYGEVERSEVIGANEDLTFVIEVRALISSAGAGDAPSEPGVELSEGALETTFEDLVAGEGEVLEPGKTALIRYVNFRGDNGVAIESNWTSDPLQIPYSEEQLFPGLFKGMEGMNVGGRRAITIPPDEGFGPDGNPQGGLPAGTDMIFVIELLGAY